MLEFPKESIKQAREIVSRYKDRSKSKENIARRLFYGDFYRIGYGFSESIKSGNCGRYLHEIKKEADCYTMAGVLYLIAREAGLKPRLYWAQGMKDVAEGANKLRSGRNDHSFIVVETGKNIQTLVDPFMGSYGKVKFNHEKNKMEIYEKHTHTLKTRDYRIMTQMSEQEYLERLEKNRTSLGGRLALSATQKVMSLKHSCHVTYLPETNELRSSLHFKTANFGLDNHESGKVIEVTTKVASNGEFDFEQGRIDSYNVTTAGWTEHTNPKTPFSFLLKDARQIFSIWEDFIRQTGRKTSPTRMHYFPLLDKLVPAGFDDSFGLIPNSDAERFIIDSGLQDTWKSIQAWKVSVVRENIEAARKKEIDYKIILRNSLRAKKSNSVKTPDSPYGLIHSKEEREAVIYEEFEKYKILTDKLVKDIIHTKAVESRLIRGSNYHAERRANTTLNMRAEQGQYFEDMAAYHASRNQVGYHVTIDKFLFDRAFDIDNVDITEVEKQLTKEDIQKGTEKQFFYQLFSIWSDLDSLLLRQYKKGLVKILNQEQ